jgi:hypothetical protein
VVLAVTNGKDESSRMRWADVSAYAHAASAAVFGVSYFYTPPGSQLAPANMTMGMTLRAERPDQYRDFNVLCQSTGGLIFTTDQSVLADALSRFATTLRQRYIVEFPRPSNATAGPHTIDVRVENSRDFILAGGMSFPVVNASILADPTTVRSDPSHAPIQGKQRPSPEMQ